MYQVVDLQDQRNGITATGTRAGDAPRSGDASTVSFPRSSYLGKQSMDVKLIYGVKPDGQRFGS